MSSFSYFSNSYGRSSSMYVFFSSTSLVVLFKFYDLKQDNQISRDELKRITEAMLFQYESTLPESILNEIVDETFQSLHLYIIVYII